MNDGAALRTEDIGTVHDQFFTLRDFRLANGSVLPQATIVYETYGRLAPLSSAQQPRPFRKGALRATPARTLSRGVRCAA